MKRKALFITFVVLTATLTALTMQAQPRRQAPGKWEGLADTPQMGWNSWNRFQGNISEDIIKGIADAEYTVGSYKNVEIDIVDQEGSSDKFKVFRVKDKDGKGIKEGYKISKGATIIVYECFVR